MDLRIVNYACQGDIANEKVVIEVINDCNLTQYEIEDNTGKKRRLQDLDVKVGDYIWYYTTWPDRIISTVFPKYKFSVHEIWWGLNDPIWNIANNVAKII